VLFKEGKQVSFFKKTGGFGAAFLRQIQLAITHKQDKATGFKCTFTYVSSSTFIQRMTVQPSFLRTVNVVRYVTPLREGGSLPAIVEADDQFLYVLKFRGAGQGKKALIAELLGGEIARALGFRVPEIVFANLDAAFGRIEGDEEIQDLLKASVGLNLALHYLSGSITFDPLATKVDAMLASKIVWLDSLLLNMDRTARNTNMLWWHKELWLIDHGACLYFHHSWQDWQNPQRPFPNIKDHVLLPIASKLNEAGTAFRSIITPQHIRSMVSLIPDEWLTDEAFESIEAHRNAYEQFLNRRIAHADFFVNEARHARESLI
jgi:hypothetical protein